MEKDWKYYYEEGVKFGETARKSVEKKRKFNNELVYNVASLSIERLLLSIFLYHNKIPQLDTIGGMARELCDFIVVNRNFMDEIRFISRFNYYCSLEFETPRIPDDVEILRIVEFINDVIEFADRELVGEIAV